MIEAAQSKTPIRVAVIFNVILPKNKVQFESAQELGYHIDAFVTQYEQSIPYATDNCTVRPLHDGALGRLTQFVRYFRKHRRDIHHLELYPGGRFACVYLLLARLFRVKTLCVERGDILYHHKGGYGLITRLSMSACYRWSNVVWYREPYMQEKLEALGARKLTFLHNAVEVSDCDPMPAASRNIDFLWANRVVPQRMAHWIVDILKGDEFRTCKSVFCGMLGDRSNYVSLEKVILEAEHVEAKEFCDPRPYYARAKFFLLPADIVFANFALLEAMSCGVVPIVSDVGRADLIVENGRNGFCVPHTRDAFEGAMKHVLSIPPAEYDRLSAAAAETIRTRFSKDAFKSGLAAIYRDL